MKKANKIDFNKKVLCGFLFLFAIFTILYTFWFCGYNAYASDSIEVDDCTKLVSAINNSNGTSQNPTEIKISVWICIDQEIVIPTGKHVSIYSDADCGAGFYRQNGFAGNMFTVNDNSTLCVKDLNMDGGGKEDDLYEDSTSLSIISSSSFSTLKLDNCGFYNNRSSAAPALNILGNASLNSVAVCNNVSGGCAVQTSQNSEVHLNGKINISDNYQKYLADDNSDEASLYSADLLIEDGSKTVIDCDFDKTSRVQVNLASVSMQAGTIIACANTQWLSLDNNFGYIAESFSINNSDLIAYAVDNNILLMSGNDSDDAFKVGNGTNDKPFYISTPEELVMVSEHYSSSFVLTQNLNLSGIGTWRPLCSDNAFTGTFNGLFNNTVHKISNITINDDSCEESENLGLFAQIDGGNVTNLNLNTSSSISTDSFETLGSVVGINSGSLQNISIDDSSKISIGPECLEDVAIGGISGISSGSYVNCVFNGAITTHNGANLDDYPNVGTFIGVVDVNNSPESVQLLPKNITAHSGGISGMAMNTIEDVVGNINCGADFIEVDVRPDSNNVPRLGHDNVGTTSPILEEVLKLLIDDGKSSEYSSYLSQINEKSRRRVKIQLDIKDVDSIRFVLPVIDRLYQQNQLDITRVMVAGDSTYKCIYDYSLLVDDTSGWYGNYRVLDLLHDLQEDGLIVGLNPDKVQDDGYDSLEEHDIEFIKKIQNDMQFSKDHILMINANHQKVSSKNKSWEWLKSYGIDMSVWTLPYDSTSVNTNFSRGHMNVTTKSNDVYQERNRRLMQIDSNCSAASNSKLFMYGQAIR